MIAITGVLLAFAALLAFTNWRWGLFLCVLTGLLQDPLRKLAPDQPAYYVVLVGVVLGCAWMGALLAGVRLAPAAMAGWRRQMGGPFGLFLLLVAVQAVNSFSRFGSAMLTGIGLMVWLAPLPAVVLAYQYARRRGEAGVRRWLHFYCLAVGAFLPTIYLEFSGANLPALGEVGGGLVIYDVGTVLKAYAGLFRSSEIAAWHAATTSAFVFLLLNDRRMTLGRLAIAGLLIAAVVSLGVLTGRRKMLVEVALFLGGYFGLYAWFQRGGTRLAVGLFGAAVLSWAAVIGLTDPDPTSSFKSRADYRMTQDNQFSGYALRGQSVFEDIPARFSELGVAPVSWAVASFGWMGAGLGTGSQTGGRDELAQGINRGAAEGGLGKITMELGVPGLLLVGWMVWRMARHLWGILALATRASPRYARLAYGLVALLMAKLGSFSVASQAYSDLFILLIMGWLMGFLLAIPEIVSRNRQQTVPVRPGGANGGHASPRWRG